MSVTAKITSLIVAFKNSKLPSIAEAIRSDISCKFSVGGNYTPNKFRFVISFDWKADKDF